MEKRNLKTMSAEELYRLYREITECPLGKFKNHNLHPKEILVKIIEKFLKKPNEKTLEILFWILIKNESYVFLRQFIDEKICNFSSSHQKFFKTICTYQG